MKGQYFDSWEFRHILHLVETNPLEAKLQFEEYLEKYTCDHSAYVYYSYVLIVLGYFKEAEGILEYVKNTYINDYIFMKDKKKVDLIRENIIFNTFKLLSYQERYEELFYFCKEHKLEIKRLNLYSFDFYSKCKLGIKSTQSKEKLPYLYKQIDNYSEEEFFEHIKKHLADYNYDIDEPNEYVFVPDFPLDKVFEEIKKLVPSERRLYTGFYENVYIFKYNGCGRAKNRLVNYFRVIALHGTNNFITMFPSDDCETLPYIDLNYLKQEEEKPKTRRLSQIDKFNQRYKR